MFTENSEHVNHAKRGCLNLKNDVKLQRGEADKTDICLVVQKLVIKDFRCFLCSRLRFSSINHSWVLSEEMYIRQAESLKLHAEEFYGTLTLDSHKSAEKFIFFSRCAVRTIGWIFRWVSFQRRNSCRRRLTTKSYWGFQNRRRA